MTKAKFAAYLFSPLVVLVVVPSLASAQSTISGVVKDASGAVMPGVTVEAASEALIERSRTVVTNGDGRYTIVDVRPGLYTMTFTLPGFSTVKQQATVPANVSIPVDAELKVSALEETVTVAATTPTVDIENV